MTFFWQNTLDGKIYAFETKASLEKQLQTQQWGVCSGHSPKKGKKKKKKKAE